MSASPDQRDPALLGHALQAMQENGDTLSQTYDRNAHRLEKIADYDPRPVRHHEDYRRELLQRTLEGDKYARSMLESGEAFQEGDDR